MICAGIDSDYCDSTSLQAMFFPGLLYGDFFYDHAVVVIGGVCVQNLKILINAGTSQSVLSTPKDLLPICTGQHNIYHNIHVYGIEVQNQMSIFSTV